MEKHCRLRKEKPKSKMISSDFNQANVVLRPNRPNGKDCVNESMKKYHAKLNRVIPAMPADEELEM